MPKDAAHLWATTQTNRQSGEASRSPADIPDMLKGELQRREFQPERERLERRERPTPGGLVPLFRICTSRSDALPCFDKYTPEFVQPGANPRLNRAKRFVQTAGNFLVRQFREKGHFNGLLFFMIQIVHCLS